MNIFNTITVQKNLIVLTGCKRFSDITFLSSQISTFGMVIVCTGTDHRRRSVEIYVGLSFQCSRSVVQIRMGAGFEKWLHGNLLLEISVSGTGTGCLVLYVSFRKPES